MADFIKIKQSELRPFLSALCGRVDILEFLYQIGSGLPARDKLRDYLFQEYFGVNTPRLKKVNLVDVTIENCLFCNEKAGIYTNNGLFQTRCKTCGMLGEITFSVELADKAFCIQIEKLKQYSA